MLVPRRADPKQTHRQTAWFLGRRLHHRRQKLSLLNRMQVQRWRYSETLERYQNTRGLPLSTCRDDFAVSVEQWRETFVGEDSTSDTHFVDRLQLKGCIGSLGPSKSTKYSERFGIGGYRFLPLPIDRPLLGICLLVSIVDCGETGLCPFSVWSCSPVMLFM